MITIRDEEFMIIQNKVERQQIMEAIKTMFPNIEDAIKIENFEKLIRDEVAFEYNEDFITSITNKRELLMSLIINASQQFCFWLIPMNQSIRVLKSSDFEDVNWQTAWDVVSKSVTLRKERSDILRQLWKRVEMHNPDDIRYFMETPIFNNDFFKKKKNLLSMFLIRFKKHLGFEPSKEFIDSINPAIDYQIPKMLRSFNIIEYPEHLANRIDAGRLIKKDSPEELFIRSVTYYALVKIQEKFNFNQVKLDWWLWSNRNDRIVQKCKHHCTLTEDY